MNLIRPRGLVNIQLMQLVPHNCSVHKWKITVPKLVFHQLRGPGSPGSVSITKNEAKNVLHASAFSSSLFVR